MRLVTFALHGDAERSSAGRGLGGGADQQQCERDGSGERDRAGRSGDGGIHGDSGKAVTNRTKQRSTASANSSSQTFTLSRGGARCSHRR